MAGGTTPFSRQSGPGVRRRRAGAGGDEVAEAALFRARDEVPKSLRAFSPRAFAGGGEGLGGVEPAAVEEGKGGLDLGPLLAGKAGEAHAIKLPAFSLLRRRPGFEDVRLVIVGSGEENKYAGLRRTAEITGMRNDVRFFGFVPDRTLAALYRLASVFAFPSLYEGFGLPPLEAMACGTPVVTSKLSSLPEVVGDAAVFVDPWSIEDIASGLERALDDEALRASLRAKGFERVKAFSWERSVRAIHAGYMKVLGQPVTALAAEPTR